MMWQLQLHQQQIQNNIAILLHVIQNRYERRQEGRRIIIRSRTVWVRPWLQRRTLLGQYERLMTELEAEDLSSFRIFTRMEPVMFRELLMRLGDRISKKDTFYRKALHPGLKLAITLRYYVSGDNYHSLM